MRRDNKKPKHLRELRDRLYKRGGEKHETKRTKLNKSPKDANQVPKEWDVKSPKEKSESKKANSSHIPSQKPKAPTPETEPKDTGENTVEDTEEKEEDANIFEKALSGDISGGKDTMAKTSRRKNFRKKIIGGSLIFFIGAALISILVILLGGNSISGENIEINVNGPLTVGGGEDLSLQVSISNYNDVAIQSATLIVEYPNGTQEAGEGNERLSMERIPLSNVSSGETVNIPLRAKVFGEENEEQQINLSVEYRVENSNATFFKEADPYSFKISSSPVSLTINAINEVAAGQEIDIEVEVTSNSANSLSDVLLQLEYPTGFEIKEASEEPVSGTDTWLIDNLDPEESYTLELVGVLTGNTSEARVLRASAGVSSADDSFALSSIFTTDTNELVIEQPFIDVELTGSRGETGVVTVAPGDRADLQVSLENTLDDSVYDGRVSVSLSGNALRNAEISATDGFYDSNTQTVTWDSGTSRGLGEISPGDTRTLSFSLSPNSNINQTPQINMEVSVYARRVRESQVSESLIGTAKTSLKVASEVSAGGFVQHQGGPFENTGPIPPVAEQVTSYTIQLEASNGSNDVSNAVMTATLPGYVTWRDQTVGRGSVSYNQSRNLVTWDIGDMSADETVTSAFKVSILPSSSQIGTTPRLVNDIRFEATDRFTGQSISSRGGSLTTSISESEPDGGDGTGRVQSSN